MTLVSVITPTWQRHQLLTERCMQSVFTQSYGKIEHVVVSDGPDQELAHLLAMDLWRRPRDRRPLSFKYLTEHLPDHSNFGSRARNYGLDAVTGELIAYLDDDNAYRKNHIELLVQVMNEHPEIDFAYTQMVRHPREDIIGADPPSLGQIDTSVIMHRRDSHVKFGGWPVPGNIYHCPDWEMIEIWMAKGAKWLFVPEITVDYYFQ